VKRSRQIRLILIGSLSAGTLAGCTGKAPISPNAVYTNNFYVPGVGYYHAPFRAWYYQRFNYFEPTTGKYFYGGKWGNEPFESITNISSPTADMASLVEANRTDVRRGGFGGSSVHFSGGHYYGGGYHGGYGG
jgi:hypothetical protein